MTDKKRIVALVMAVTLSITFFLRSKDVVGRLLLGHGKSTPKLISQAPDSKEPFSREAVLPRDHEELAQLVRIDRSILDQIVTGRCKKIEIALFDGESVVVGINQRDPYRKDGVIVYGTVEGEINSWVHIAIVREAMYAMLRLTDGREYRIDYIEEERFRFAKVNANLSHDPPPPGVPEQDYMIIDGRRVHIASCYFKMMPRDKFSGVRMLEGEEWSPGLRVLETANQEEQHVSQINRRQVLESSKAGSYPHQGRGVKTTTSNSGVKPFVGILTGFEENIPSTRRLIARLPNGTILPQHGDAWRVPQNETAGNFAGGFAHLPSGMVRQQQQQNTQQQQQNTQQQQQNTQQQQQQNTQQQQQQNTQQQQQQGGGIDPTFGIMIVYTPNVANDLGGDSAAQAKALSRIGVLNSALNDSGVPEQAKLVHAAKTSRDFSSTELMLALNYMKGDATINSWRDQYKADLVHCLVDGRAGGTMAGLAYVLKGVTLPPPAHAAKDLCWGTTWHTPNADKTFAHEIGHNLGLHHEKSSGETGLFSYSNGSYFDLSNGEGWHSAMAYAKSGYTKWANVFCGPNVKFQGTTTGDPAHDCAKTVTQTIPHVKLYR